MTPELFLSLTDELGAGFGAIIGDPATGTGCGDPSLPLPGEGDGDVDWGLSLAQRRFSEKVLVSRHLPLIKSTLVNGPSHFHKASNAAGIAHGQFYLLVNSLSDLCIVPDPTVRRSVRSFLEYHNTGAGGSWNCLVSPLFAELFVSLWPSYPLPGSCIASRDNVSLGSRETGKAFTPGQGENQDKSSGLPNLTASLSDGCEFGQNGRLTVIVTGQGRLPDGTIEECIWSGDISQDPSETSAAFACSVPNARALSVTDITLPPSLLAGSVKIIGSGSRAYPLLPV